MLPRRWADLRAKLFANHELNLALAVTVVLIVAGLFLGWANNRVAPVHPFPGFHYILEPHNPLSFFASWDAPDYIQIAKDGYTNSFWINWFPLYPLAIRLAHLIISSWLDAALFVSWASLVGALYFYIKIVRRLFHLANRTEPLQALLYFVLFPTGMFLIAPFSESLYAFWALGAIYFALQKNWLWAGVMGAFCTAIHITGPFIVVLTALILLEERAKLWQAAAAGAVGSLGLLTYMAYLFNRFHQPLGFLEAQQIYHGWTNHTYASLLTTAGFSSAGLTLLIIVTAVYWWRRRRSFALYSLMFLAIPLVGRQWGGFDRYVLMAFPLPWMFYDVFRRRATLLPYITAGLGVIWTYFLLQYAGGWIGS